MRTLCKVSGIVALFSALVALPAIAQLQGSVHDFSSEGWSGGDMCAVCHVPHSARSGVDSAPVWNHDVSTTTYSLYSSRTLAQSPEQPGNDNVSRLCLSCHDGTIALDSFGGNSGQNYISERASLGTDLSNDHPIAVRWSGQGNGSGLPGEGVKLFEGKVECPSCHDVHNNEVTDEKLLRVSRQGSELCFKCHEK